jgi:hypothetical protein
MVYADTYYALRDELDLIRAERDALAERVVEREREIASLRAMLPSYWIDRTDKDLRIFNLTWAMSMSELKRMDPYQAKDYADWLAVRFTRQIEDEMLAAQRESVK